MTRTGRVVPGLVRLVAIPMAPPESCTSEQFVSVSGSPFSSRPAYGSAQVMPPSALTEKCVPLLKRTRPPSRPTKAFPGNPPSWKASISSGLVIGTLLMFAAFFADGPCGWGKFSQALQTDCTSCQRQVT